MGQFVEGSWEVSERAILPALLYTLSQLERCDPHSNASAEQLGASPLVLCPRVCAARTPPLPSKLDPFQLRMKIVRKVAPCEGGAATGSFCVRNYYSKGEPFTEPHRSQNRKRAKAAHVPEEEEQVTAFALLSVVRDPLSVICSWEWQEDDLADVEVQRRENIRRNKEMLKLLGLA